ncbi:hypothetical protein Ahy_A08g039030 [Arachis hypogaea]|uniref:GRF-type domain-containing protein n=1 Tax=Arachis hypogaea TaxID=3818 RepID=A0A445BV09_ARAHY|nr:hypothetical protein Ahy_A08g039030 [Arachis hypogaea]
MPGWRRVAGDKICFHMWGSQWTCVVITRKPCLELFAAVAEEELRPMIKKSGTRENPDRLFHACPRYRKGSHCNYFRWVEDDDYEGLENLGEVKTDAQMESDAALLNHNISWRMMTLEAEVKALRMQLYFGLIVVIVVFMIMCMFFSGK